MQAFDQHGRVVNPQLMALAKRGMVRRGGFSGDRLSPWFIAMRGIEELWR
jgi:hypothetical protein